MPRLRPIFSLILVSLATLLISCGGPNVAATPPTYTPEQLEKIQEYSPKIVAVKERSAELQELIEDKDWINVDNFIHGPMTEAKLNMKYLASNLLPEQQKSAQKILREMSSNLVKIYDAAKEADIQQALNSYDAAFADIDKFLDLVPENTASDEA